MACAMSSISPWRAIACPARTSFISAAFENERVLPGVRVSPGRTELNAKRKPAPIEIVR
jgi:hypothetical protein